MCGVINMTMFPDPNQTGRLGATLPGQGQPGFLQRLFSNPQFLQGLTQLALTNIGKYGGARGAAFGQEVQRQGDILRAQQEAESNRRWDEEKQNRQLTMQRDIAAAANTSREKIVGMGATPTQSDIADDLLTRKKGAMTYWNQNKDNTKDPEKLMEETVTLFKIPEEERDPFRRISKSYKAEEPTETQPSFQRVQLMDKNGKPFMADYNPKTREYLKAGTNEIVKDPRLYVKPEDVTASGLDPRTELRALQEKNRFDSNPIVTNYNEVQNKFQSVKQMVEQPGGPFDLAIVFEFMKGLDPTSVVRESEYKSAAESGNIFRGWAARFNGLIDPKGGFLSEEVRKDFLNILNIKMEAASRQYQNVYNKTLKRIDMLTGKEGSGKLFLTDYSKAFAETMTWSDVLAIAKKKGVDPSVIEQMAKDESITITDKP